MGLGDSGPHIWMGDGEPEEDNFYGLSLSRPPEEITVTESFSGPI